MDKGFDGIDDRLDNLLMVNRAEQMAQHPSKQWEAPDGDISTDDMRDPDPYIVTYTGRKFYLLSPDASMVDQEDLVESTARIPRYTGHAGDYSVADHSIMVHDIVAEMTTDLTIRQQALIHDLAEAYMNDISSPMKIALVACGLDFRRFREPIERAVYDYYNVPYPNHELVRTADDIALALEWRTFYKERLWEERGIEAPRLSTSRGRTPIPEEFQDWQPQKSDCLDVDLQCCLEDLFA